MPRRNTKISADFVGVLCDEWRARGHGQAVFVNGALGAMIAANPSSYDSIKWIGYAVGIVNDLVCGGVAGWIAKRRGAAHGAPVDLAARHTHREGRCVAGNGRRGDGSDAGGVDGDAERRRAGDRERRAREGAAVRCAYGSSAGGRVTCQCLDRFGTGPSSGGRRLRDLWIEHDDGVQHGAGGARLHPGPDHRGVPALASPDPDARGREVLLGQLPAKGRH